MANPSVVVFTMVKSLPLRKIHPIRCRNILLQQFTKQICNIHVALIKATHIERDMTPYPSSVQKIMCKTFLKPDIYIDSNGLGILKCATPKPAVN